MKTLLFFHREELTNMYIGMTKWLVNQFNIIHVAYSMKEEKLLKVANITDHIINLTTYVNEIFDREKLNYDILSEIDDFFIENTNGRFTLNGSIQSDRGISILDYDQALLITQIYYKFWKKIFNDNKINYVMHEPPSLLFNHICAVMCSKNQALYIYQIMASSDNPDYTYFNVTDDKYHALEIVKNYNKYATYVELIDRVRCQSFIKKFRNDYSVFLGDRIKKNDGFLKLRIAAFKEFLAKIKHINQFHPQKNNIDYWSLNQCPNKERINNLTAYKKFIKFEDLDISRKYYYYSLHLEPEAVVLYLADGIYKNQVKLIENIAAQLPVGTYLYVKDHPHELGYRSVEDYKRLQLIPNIKLLYQSIPGKEVIKNAIGVFTLNGTAGFEALLLNKQVYIFGTSFYDVCKRVNYIKNIRDLREILYRNINTNYSDDTELYAFVNAYLDSLRKGVVDYFCDRAKTYGVNLVENEERLAKDFIEFSKVY